MMKCEKGFEEITCIDISFEYDDEGNFEHYCYCQTIDEAIQVLTEFKNKYLNKEKN